MVTCVTPANVCGLETVALTERQQQRLQVCENNWVRRFVKVDRRKMDEMREDTGVLMSLTENWLQAG